MGSSAQPRIGLCAMKRACNNAFLCHQGSLTSVTTDSLKLFMMGIFSGKAGPTRTLGPQLLSASRTVSVLADYG